MSTSGTRLFRFRSDVRTWLPTRAQIYFYKVKGGELDISWCNSSALNMRSLNVEKFGGVSPGFAPIAAYIFPLTVFL